MLEDDYRISSPEMIVEIGNKGDVEMAEYDQISLVADGIWILNVTGEGCVLDFRQLVKYHGDLMELDMTRFIVLAENWYRQRGYDAKIRVNPKLTWWRKALLNVLLGLVKSSFQN